MKLIGILVALMLSGCMPDSMSIGAYTGRETYLGEQSRNNGMSIDFTWELKQEQ